MLTAFARFVSSIISRTIALLTRSRRSCEEQNCSGDDIATLDSESGEARWRGKHLNGRQLEVWRALRSKGTSKFPFNDWYVAALATMAQPEDVNPDRMAQAANSLREILEKIPRALETEVLGADRNILEQRRAAMTSTLAEAKS